MLRRSVVCVLFVWQLVAGARAQDGALADDPEPTPQETLALELLNRVRADPKGEAERLATPPFPRKPFEQIDWDMFRAEMAAIPPAAPLVFDPRLIRAARNHSAYIVKNKLYGHDEVAGKAGFSGEAPAKRLEFAGFARHASECTVGHAPSAAAEVFGCVVDDGPGGQGGMQDGRGHRAAALASGLRHIGIGHVSHGEKDADFASTWEIGTDKDVRHAGGVFFIDLDGDHAYDVGEGVGGVDVRCEKAQGFAWPSGAWALPVEGDKAARLEIRFRGLSRSAEVAAGTANVKIDADLLGDVAAKIEAIAARCEKAAEGSAERKKAGPELAAFIDGLPLPEALQKRVAPLAADGAKALAEARAATLRALNVESDAECAKILRDRRAAFRSTVADPWFADAERVLKERKAVIALEGQASKGLVKRKDLQKARESVQAALADVSPSDLRHLLFDHRRRVAEIGRGSGQ